MDVLSQRDIELYQQWQAGNRQRNAELYEYERMKAYYESQGKEPPYNTLGAFRRARRAQSKAYTESRKEWGKAKPREEKPKNPPKTATSEKKNTQNPLTNEENSGIIEEQNVQIETDGLPKLTIPNKQFGKKSKRHMKEYNLDVSKADDREKYKQMILDFRHNYDEIRIGEWAGQQEEVLFYIKGEDVMITKLNGEFVSLFKGGINNARVKNARRKQI